MTDLPQEPARPNVDELPEPIVRRRGRGRPSMIWLVPIVAGLAGVLLLVRAYLETGPTIKISFKTAEGLDAGKTEVRYKDVVLGKVKSVEMSDDRSHVVAKVALNSEAGSIAVEDTQFWVVRVRADLGGISGFKTLVSGTYIGVNLGKSTDSQRRFTGLEDPPILTNDEKGRRFNLTTSDLGSLNIGSPVYYLRVPVGRVLGFELDKEGKYVNVIVFIEEPYDRFVKSDTQFWSASGIDLSFDANGLKLDTQSVVTLLAGGVAFQSLASPDAEVDTKPVQDGANFSLYPNQASALAPRDAVVMPIRMRFFESVRGLAVDGPIDFKGTALGRITRVDLGFDSQRKRFYSEVSADLYPRRMGRAYAEIVADDEEVEENQPELLFVHMVEHGLRGQLRAGNLITGQLYVALDFPPKPSKSEFDSKERPLRIPTETASLDQIQTRITDIVSKVDQIPFDEIGKRLNSALGNADALMKKLDGEVAPAATETLKQARDTLESARGSLTSADAPIQQDMRRTLIEVERTVRSLRDLSDYLQRHPESLIRGRPEAKEPHVEEPAR